MGEVPILGIDWVMRRRGAGTTPEHAPESKSQGLRTLQRSGVVNVYNMDLVPRRRSPSPRKNGHECLDRVAGLHSEHPHANVPNAIRKESIEHQRRRGCSASPPPPSQRAASPPYNLMVQLSAAEHEAQRMTCRSPNRGKSLTRTNSGWNRAGQSTPVEAPKRTQSMEDLRRRRESQVDLRKTCWQESSYLITQALQSACFQAAVLPPIESEHGAVEEIYDYTKQPTCPRQLTNTSSAADSETATPASPSDRLYFMELPTDGSCSRFYSDERSAIKRSTSALTVTTTTGGMSRTGSTKSFVLSSKSTSSTDEPSLLQLALSGRVPRKVGHQHARQERARCEARMAELVRLHQNKSRLRIA